jgi:hypothetical protein
MSNLKLVLGTLILLLVFGCQRKIEPFSKEKPYAIQIAKERSFYQAEKLTNRLIDLDIDAYMFQYEDSSDNDGQWYYILANNMETLDSAKSVRSRIENKFKLKDLKVVTYESFEKAIFELEELKQSEKQKIASNKPGVKEEIFNVMEKFPESNSLIVQKTFVLNTPNDPENMKGFSQIYSMSMDLPRGIKKKLILKNTTAFSEVIYKDNLYGDRVTIDIGKLRARPSDIEQGSMITSRNRKSFEIAEQYADLILKTGEYDFEEKKEIEVKSYTKLYGYKVTIEPRKNYFRTYLILVDDSQQYIIFSQSTDKTEEELLAILSDIGKGKGLLNYNEFYNVFYTIPDQIVDQDQFVGFTIDKLGWSYAQNRGYVRWSKEMVGHWQASGYFYNDKKGLWAYGIFDLLTKGKQNHIYNGLYAKDRSRNKYKIDVYGTNGFILYRNKYNRRAHRSYKKVREISFGIDRYISAINNTENAWFTKDELLQRAESLQFEKIVK